jgi:hypothetical protein
VLSRTFFSRCHSACHPRQKPRGLPIVTQVPRGIEEFRKPNSRASQFGRTEGF